MELTGPLSIAAKKSALRLIMRRRRQALAEAARKEYSRAICKHLEAWAREHTPPGGVLALYAAHNFEPNVDEVGRTWLAEGRALALPRVVQTREGSQLQFVTVRSLDALKPGNLGLREAWGPDAHVIDVAKLSAIAVPCLAIAADGTRLGSGMGVYDRALMGHAMPQVGVTFTTQIEPELPCAPFDLRVGAYITEAGLTACNCQEDGGQAH